MFKLIKKNFSLIIIVMVIGMFYVQADSQKDFSDLVFNSDKFNDTIARFPTQNNRISQVAGKDQVRQRKIVEHAIDTYPLIHADVLNLLQNFLEFKKQNGTEIEKKLYDVMTLEQFIIRLLENRPLMFMTASDQYLLRGGKKGSGGFEKIGTGSEIDPLILKEYLSYDEMAVAALLGMSVPTYFINNGSRDNKGIKGIAGSYEQEGVYAGLVGARFEKPNYMEWQNIIITPEQNTVAKGYGFTASDTGLLSLWSQLYGEKFPTFEQAQKDTTGRFVLLKNGFYFDMAIYKKRIRLVIEPFLRDAHDRAKKQNKKAYVHVVGLGLGVWQIDSWQANWMLDACADIIKNNNLSHISDIDFSWFDTATEQSKNNIIKIGNEKNIAVAFSKRNPADKLTGNNAGKLLIACYAWDGNSYPGNEYWAGMLTASGDPAAACCSTIAELQNPKINSYIKENIEKMFVKYKADVKQVQMPQEQPSVSLWQRMMNKVKQFVGWKD